MAGGWRPVSLTDREEDRSSVGAELLDEPDVKIVDICPGCCADQQVRPQLHALFAAVSLPASDVDDGLSRVVYSRSDHTLISQQPNFIYSRDRLADDQLSPKLWLAERFLSEPE